MRYRIFLNGRKVAEILIRRGMTRTEFARRAKTSPTHVWRLISKRQAPSAGMMQRIQSVLRGAKWDDIFRMEESATSAAA